MKRLQATLCLAAIVLSTATVVLTVIGSIRYFDSFGIPYNAKGHARLLGRLPAGSAVTLPVAVVLLISTLRECGFPGALSSSGHCRRYILPALARGPSRGPPAAGLPDRPEVGDFFLRSWSRRLKPPIGPPRYKKNPLSPLGETKSAGFPWGLSVRSGETGLFSGGFAGRFGGGPVGLTEDIMADFAAYPITQSWGVGEVQVRSAKFQRTAGNAGHRVLSAFFGTWHFSLGTSGPPTRDFLP
jgi:hypothetical protein